MSISPIQKIIFSSHYQNKYKQKQKCIAHIEEKNDKNKIK